MISPADARLTCIWLHYPQERGGSALSQFEESFGADIDYAMLVKLYGEGPKTEARYSPAVCVGARKDVITGRPHKDYISTLHLSGPTCSGACTCAATLG